MNGVITIEAIVPWQLSWNSIIPPLCFSEVTKIRQGNHSGWIRNMHLYKDMKIAIAGLQMFLLFDVVLCITTKRSLCVEYEIPSYRANGPLNFKSRQSRAECLSICVRHEDCLAVNYNPTDGTCELLPEAPRCFPANNNNNTAFCYIHLTTCDGHSPWRTDSAKSDAWQWLPTNNPEDISNALVPMVTDFTRYVSRVLYNGVYIPCWWKDDIYMSRIVLPNDDWQKCPTNSTTFLSFESTNSYDWVPFTAGVPLPDGAVVGGIWPQAIPMYVMKVTHYGFTVSGYYRSDTKKAYVAGNAIIRTTTMHILVHNWQKMSKCLYMGSFYILVEMIDVRTIWVIIRRTNK